MLKSSSNRSDFLVLFTLIVFCALAILSLKLQLLNSFEFHPNIDKTDTFRDFRFNFSVISGDKVINHSITNQFIRSKEFYHSQHPNKVRLKIATLTSTSNRLLLGTSAVLSTIRGLLAIPSLDRVYLNVPIQYRRASIDSKLPLPSQFFELSRNSSGKFRIVFSSEDFGPLTKLLPPLLLPPSELPLDSILITVDDDRLYSEDVINSLLNASHLYFDSVLSLAGWPVSIFSAMKERGQKTKGGLKFTSHFPTTITKKGRKKNFDEEEEVEEEEEEEIGIEFRKEGFIDIINGYFGVLYKKSFFYPNISSSSFSFSSSSSTSSSSSSFDLLFSLLSLSTLPHLHSFTTTPPPPSTTTTTTPYSSLPPLLTSTSSTPPPPPLSCFFVDDIWISGMLEKGKRERRVILGENINKRKSASITSAHFISALSTEQEEKEKEQEKEHLKLKEKETESSIFSSSSTHFIIQHTLQEKLKQNEKLRKNKQNNDNLQCLSWFQQKYHLWI